jgi:hypothetical protein
MSASRSTPRQWTAEEQRKLDDLLEAGKTVVEMPLRFSEPAKQFMRDYSAATENDVSRLPAGRA